MLNSNYKTFTGFKIIQTEQHLHYRANVAWLNLLRYESLEAVRLASGPTPGSQTWDSSSMVEI